MFLDFLIKWHVFGIHRDDFKETNLKQVQVTATFPAVGVLIP